MSSHYIPLSFSNILPEHQIKHEDPRNSKEIQEFCEHLGFSQNFLKLHGFLEFPVKLLGHMSIP